MSINNMDAFIYFYKNDLQCPHFDSGPQLHKLLSYLSGGGGCEEQRVFMELLPYFWGACEGLIQP